VSRQYASVHSDTSSLCYRSSTSLANASAGTSSSSSSSSTTGNFSKAGLAARHAPPIGPAPAQVQLVSFCNEACTTCRSCRATMRHPALQPQNPTCSFKATHALTPVPHPLAKHTSILCTILPIILCIISCIILCIILCTAGEEDLAVDCTNLCIAVAHALRQ